ncbi:hypothetical protein L7F22_025078 [Adiantum nelumboides]|nr:hypothetical protein [Adiantum nelumboides]
MTSCAALHGRNINARTAAGRRTAPGLSPSSMTLIQKLRLGEIRTSNFSAGQRLQSLNVAIDHLQTTGHLIAAERRLNIIARAGNTSGSSANGAGNSFHDGHDDNDDEDVVSYLTDRAVAALLMAKQEAKLFLSHKFLACEHILLGLLLLFISELHKTASAAEATSSENGDEAPLATSSTMASEALRLSYLSGIDAVRAMEFLLQAVRQHIHFHLHPADKQRLIRRKLAVASSVTLFTYHSTSSTLFTFRGFSLLRIALKMARNLGQDRVAPEHLLLALVHLEQVQPEGYVGHRLLGAVGVDVRALEEDLIHRLTASAASRLENQMLKEMYPYSPDDFWAIDNKLVTISTAPGLEHMKMLRAFCTDLTELAQRGKLDPVVGREAQIERVLHILSRRNKNNACLVGEAGVGKTAIAEAMAQMIASGTAAGNAIAGKRVMSLDVARLLAGTHYRGELEQRIKMMMDEIRVCDRSIILFIDEIHTIVGAGGPAMDTANLLKPALARGDLQCIGATTLTEYRQYMEKDPALERRFQLVHVPAPSVEDTIRILKGLRPRYQNHHKVQYEDEALVAAAELSDRYITDRFLPDKAIDLIDEAGSYVRMKQKSMKDSRNSSRYVVSALDIERIVATWTGVPVEKVSWEESDRLLGMEVELHRQIIGQDEAVKAVSRALRRARVGLRDPNRPIASFIFCGPTGVGKSQLAKALAASYFGSEEAMVRLDMSEMMERHSVSKLIGSPPGYVGYNESGQLTEAVRRRPFTIVLLDEIEKAHPDVFNLLLQILEDGRLTDSKGRVVDFKNTLIIMTSNVGSSALQKGGRTIGFLHAETGLAHADHKLPSSASRSHSHSIVEEELKQCFKPEFLNRLDEIVVFDPLSQHDLQEIVLLMIQEVVTRMRENMKIEVQVSDRLRDKIVQHGFCPSYGARPLRRAITRLLEDGVAEHLLAGHLKEGDSAILDVTQKSPNSSSAAKANTDEENIEVVVLHEKIDVLPQ